MIYTSEILCKSCGCHSFSKSRALYGLLMYSRALRKHDLLHLAGRLHSDDHGLPRIEVLPDLFGELLVFVGPRWHAQVLLRLARLRQEAEHAFPIDVHECVLRAAHKGHAQVVGAGAKLLHLLPGEDVDGDDVRLRVAVLPRLRRRDLYALAGVALDHEVAAFPDFSSVFSFLPSIFIFGSVLLSTIRRFRFFICSTFVEIG